MPRTAKPYHIYDLEEYRRSETSGEYIYAVGTCYAKTIRGAIKTFSENHAGSFMMVYDGTAKVVNIYLH